MRERGRTPLYEETWLLSNILCIGDTTTLQAWSSWWRAAGGWSTLSGYLDMAVEEFTWSVSDESVAVLRDDYPGTNARSIVALREGVVDVTLTGPLGKSRTERVYVLPIDVFNDDGPEDDPDGPGGGGLNGFWEWFWGLWTRPPKTAPVTAISFQPPSMDMFPGDVRLTSLTVIPYDAANPNVTYASSDPAVATVNAYGLVEAVSLGMAAITATARDGSGVVGTCKVTVNPRPVERITLSAKDLTLYEGETGQLSATVKPDEATDKRVTWASGDKNIATVDQNGLVTAKKAGTTTITCAAQDKSGVKAACTVTVKPRLVESITLNVHDAEIFVGERLQLSAVVKPDNAANTGVTYTANASVASVSTGGLVIGKKPGTVTVTCTAQDGSGASDTCTILVKQRFVESIALDPSEITIYVGTSYSLEPTILPANAANKNVTYTSNNPAIAPVDSYGQVKGKKVGMATITCEAQDGSGVTATCKVTVREKPKGAALAGEGGAGLQGYESLVELPYMLMYLTNIMPWVIFQYLLQIVPSAFSEFLNIFGGLSGLLDLIAKVGKIIDDLIKRLFPKKADDPIVVNGWLTAYQKSSASGGRDVPIPSDRINNWYAFEGSVGVSALKGRSNITVVEKANGALVDENGRYWIAVGPKVFNPNYPDTGPLWFSDNGLTLGAKVDVLIKHKTTNELAYIYTVIGDIIAHTYNPGKQGHGIIHSGIPYPNSWNAKHEINPKTGTNIFPAGLTSVEFIRTTEPTNLSQYEIVKLIVY